MTPESACRDLLMWQCSHCGEKFLDDVGKTPEECPTCFHRELEGGQDSIHLHPGESLWRCGRCASQFLERGEPLECYEDQGGCKRPRGKTTFDEIRPLSAISDVRAEARAPPRSTLPARIRWTILARDSFLCRSCGRGPPDVVLVIDHVQPLSKGGTDDPENLQALCEECNAGKGDLEVA